MRKYYFAALVAIVAAFASCENLENVPATFDEYDMTFEVADPAPDTKAIKTAWEEGDEILIKFDGKDENGQQGKLKYVSDVWKVVQKPSNLGFSTGEKIYFCAVHFPGTIAYDNNADYSQKLGYKGGNIRYCRMSTTVEEGGILPLGTINLSKKLNDKEFQVVVPGINASTAYTMSITCNGKLDSREGRENAPYSGQDSYAQVFYPYFSGSSISYGGGYVASKGVANADGVAFTLYYYDATGAQGTDPYKYVFSLYDGEKIYYYTIPKASEKTLAAGMAIKLPVFDGKDAQANWKTSL